ncbi:MAG TPA: sigma-70 family RNA polymerase sigma factor [Candidatus Limnocylindria bacterium]|nr:sigma-70 family RNA polymerase sigma factor [Candidatus Limnocylindria bacterium]
MSLREELVAQYCAERTIAMRNAVVDAYRYLCVRGAKKFKRAFNDRADLEQVAAVGLIKAAEYYRTDMQTPFEAYAWIMIVGELMHDVRDHERLVRTPRSLRALEKRYLDAWDAFTTAHHREPTRGELAAALGVTIEVIDELRAIRRGERVVPSESASDGNDGGDVFGAARESLRLDERVMLALALEQLADRERAIVLGTYGVGLTQTELGERLGLSQSHVSKLLARALDKLGRLVA